MLEEEKILLQLLMNFCLEGVSDHEGEFVRIHNRCRDFHRPSPIIVIECLIICQFPEEFLTQCHSIVNDIVVSRSASALCDILRGHKEIKMVRDNFIGDNCARNGIFELISDFWEETVVDSLGDDYMGVFGHGLVGCLVDCGEDIEDGFQLDVPH